MRQLFKKSTLDPEILGNYCPVSNPPFLGKVVERPVADYLQRYLDNATFLDPYQSDFRLGYGTKTALVALPDDFR